MPVAGAAAERRDDLAVLDRKLGARRSEPLCSALQEQSADLGAGETQRLAAVLDREAARGHAFIRTVCGAGRKDSYFLEAHIQLFGGDLRQRGRDALAELDLAAGDGDGAVGLEMNALRKPARIRHRWPSML